MSERFWKRLPRILAEGVYHKIQYDFSCNRGDAFGEIYLYSIITELLTSKLDMTQVQLSLGYAADAIQAHTNTRRKELDFAVTDRGTKDIRVCGELKWAGSSHCRPKNILIDLVRLQRVANDAPDSICIFLLAGPKSEIASLFKRGLLGYEFNNLLTKPLEKHLEEQSSKIQKTFRLTGNSERQSEIDQHLIETPNDLPEKIITSPRFSTLAAPSNGRFGCHAWVVKSFC